MSLRLVFDSNVSFLGIFFAGMSCDLSHIFARCTSDQILGNLRFIYKLGHGFYPQNNYYTFYYMHTNVTVFYIQFIKLM